MKTQRGFTLIELSIVLVIVGLIVGGVLVGRDLIKAAELRSLISQRQSFTTAVMTFRDKYSALPGDMPNATSLWGVIAGVCDTGGGTGTQTCDGNGDGKINNENYPPQSETFRAWQHLSNAGLIAGKMTGYFPTTPCTSSVCWVSGINSPATNISDAIWTLRYIDASDGWSGKNTSRNALTFGIAGTSGRWHDPILNASDVYSIDKKIDDGIPFAGSLVLMSESYSGNCWNWNGIDKDPSATYKITNTGRACVLLFDLGI